MSLKSGKKYSYIIFDLDGTLLDTLEDLMDATNHVMVSFGWPEHSYAEIRSFVGNGIERLMRLSVPAGTEEETFAKAFSAFKEYYTAHCLVKTRLYDGIGELLRTLKARNIPMAIVSNKNQEAVTELYHIFFEDSVIAAVGQAAGRPKKPAPESTWLAMEKIGAEKEYTLYVGDSEVDKATADNAGLDCVLVSWGFRDKDVIETLKPVAVIDRPEELLRWVK
ncbi:MAG: HAD-IA family hydrolase [Lachnospiraceae bacterium]|nr:HAD-IA family hydrolase [Lachnospiraceae bacterium]